MPRTYLIFGHIEGKLDVLRVECTKCERKGRYHVHKLIEMADRAETRLPEAGHSAARLFWILFLVPAQC